MTRAAVRAVVRRIRRRTVEVKTPGEIDAMRAAGAVVARPIFAFPGGRRFHFIDPGGNELAVWQPV